MLSPMSDFETRRKQQEDQRRREAEQRGAQRAAGGPEATAAQHEGAPSAVLGLGLGALGFCVLAAVGALTGGLTVGLVAGLAGGAGGWFAGSLLGKQANRVGQQFERKVGSSAAASADPELTAAHAAWRDARAGVEASPDLDAEGKERLLDSLDRAWDEQERLSVAKRQLEASPERSPEAWRALDEVGARRAEFLQLCGQLSASTSGGSPVVGGDEALDALRAAADDLAARRSADAELDALLAESSRPAEPAADPAPQAVKGHGRTL